MEQGVQTIMDMALRNNPDTFVRTLVTTATVGPLWTALMQMKQARLRMASAATREASPPELPRAPELAPLRAA